MPGVESVHMFRGGGGNLHGAFVKMTSEGSVATVVDETDVARMPILPSFRVGDVEGVLKGVLERGGRVHL